MIKGALIAVCGAAGALARYCAGAALGVRSFPWATLAINLVGSFALGFVARFALDRAWSDQTTVPITVGLIGGFTTFSTFSFEAWTLLRTDRAGTAVAYLAASVLGGLIAAALGWGAARALA